MHGHSSLYTGLKSHELRPVLSAKNTRATFLRKRRTWPEQATRQPDRDAASKGSESVSAKAPAQCATGARLAPRSAASQTHLFSSQLLEIPSQKKYKDDETVRRSVSNLRTRVSLRRQSSVDCDYNSEKRAASNFLSAIQLTWCVPVCLQVFIFST